MLCLGNRSMLLLLLIWGSLGESVKQCIVLQAIQIQWVKYFCSLKVKKLYYFYLCINLIFLDLKLVYSSQSMRLAALLNSIPWFEILVLFFLLVCSSLTESFCQSSKLCEYSFNNLSFCLLGRGMKESEKCGM